MLKSYFMVPVNVVLFENRVFADVIKLVLDYSGSSPSGLGCSKKDI